MAIRRSEGGKRRGGRAFASRSGSDSTARDGLC